MKQVVFATVFLLLFLIGSIADARWIPENATPEDIQRLIKMEKEDKARIIKEEYLHEKAEKQKKEQAAAGIATNGTMVGGKEAGREVSSQAQVTSTDNYGEIQRKAAQGVQGTQEVIGGVQGIGVSGVAIKGQTMLVTGTETEKSTEVKKIQKTGWKDWLVIGFFLLISLSCLFLYIYSINNLRCKTTGKGAAPGKGTASKGVTLLEIMVATAVIAISVLCILKVFRYASLVQPQTGYSTKAMTMCQEKLEEIRNRPYENLTSITGEQEKITMGPYGRNVTTPINGGATRTVTIKRINELWHGESAPPTFEEVPVGGTFTYLKANVKMEWGSIPIRNESGVVTGSIPLKRELSIFIAPRLP
ncbi:MAG: prepilin-type N-terminal cleavage/methylation domain-containing protein [bacterium]